jgi:degradative hydroxymethylglutaryl-CoA reductase
MTVPVSAPGKAFLIGEYAVLEGAPAIVTAVGVRAVAHAASDGGPHDGTSAVVRCAHARAAEYLAGRGETALPAPVVNTGPFSFGPRKLGLGSSAAVAAAVVGYQLAASGLDPRDPEVAADALALAMAAHAEAQGGGGSGADVAAAVLGGTLRFCAGEAEPVTPPPWLQIAFIDAGQPAVTSSFIQAVKAAAGRDRPGYDAAMAMLRQAASAFGDAFCHDTTALARGTAPDEIERRYATIRSATVRHVEGLRALQALTGAPILTPAIEAILAAATEAGIAAKPSGAGGGDLVVLFHPDRGQLDRLGERLRRAHGLMPLCELSAHAEGLRSDDKVPTNSRLAGFFKLSIEDRRAAIASATGIPIARMRDLDAGSLDVHRANHMIENVVGTLELPLAIATNFQINGVDVLVPMCVEEASVVAAASNAAKMIRMGGGFAAHSDPPWMIAQVQLTPGTTGALEPEAAAAAVRAAETEILALADTAHPRLLERGGGARQVEARVLDPSLVVVHVIVDCRDAMGANLLNTVAEITAPRLEALTGWVAGLRILSNLADRRCAHVSARIPPEALATPSFPGSEVVDGIVSASRFAELDPYRATTHNKGIMNGVDAVVLATGNDWRAMESSAHAFAAREGRYRPLAIWRRGEDGWLEGSMSLPAAVGVVGGATRVHPVARLALEILGCRSGAELGQVMAAAGLASNLAALRAMATEGIQRGHMSLHARSIALGVGAEGHEIERLAARLIEDGEIKAERAAALLDQLRAQHSG